MGICTNCIYFKTCGSHSRTQKCNGKVTKAQKKREERKEKRNDT